MDEQLKLAHKTVAVLVRANKKICVFLLCYNVDVPETFHAHVRFFARKQEEEEAQQIVYLKKKPEEFIYLLDVLISV